MIGIESVLHSLDYFHYPASKSPEYKELSARLTTKYSTLTGYALIGFIALISANNFLSYKGWSNVYRVRLFKRLCSRLNREILKDSDKERLAAKARFALFMKKASLKLLYHGSVILQVAFWTILFSILSLTDINDGDLIILGKRLGRMSCTCLPTIFFLTLRPSLLPKTLYLSLLPIHKWLSRFVILQSSIHTTIYCGLFQKRNTWFKVLKWENLFGIAAMLGFLIIMLTSLSGFRNKHYRTFYFQHYFWSWIIVISLQLHARPIKISFITSINLLILTSQIIYRLRLTKITTSNRDLKVINASPNLSVIEFPKSLINNPPQTAGSHVRLTDYSPSIFTRIYKQVVPNYHPYTLVTLPNDEKQILIVRSSTFKILNYQKYIIYGSFDPFLHFIKSPQKFDRFSISKLKVDAKRVMIVIGGSAISFAIPIMRVLNYHGIPCKVIWVIRDYRDIAVLKWFKDVIDFSSFEIFVTGVPRMHSVKTMRSDNSLGKYLSFWKCSKTGSTDIENPETENLLERDSFSLNEENQLENVEISMDDAIDDYYDEECPQNTINIANDNMNTISNELSPGIIQEHAIPNHNVEEPGNPSYSLRTYSSFNGKFVPSQSSISSYEENNHQDQFFETARFLQLENRIYHGRPKLDQKYYNWCISEGFTQCSGPVEDNSSNLVCCRDIIRTSNREKVDTKKIWIVSAGPKGLVKNVKLWANENGFNFHEEAFYV